MLPADHGEGKATRGALTTRPALDSAGTTLIYFDLEKSS